MTSASLVSLSAVTDGDVVTIVIETPRGSRNKYDYDPDALVFRLKSVLPEGMSFPYDFGFIPGTLGEDGDPLDILVMLDSPAPPGIMLEGRLLGAIEARQREAGKDWRRNDRLLAAAVYARTHAHISRLEDLRPGLVEEICEFFRQYNALNGREFERLDQVGPEAARRLVEQGVAAFSRARTGA